MASSFRSSPPLYTEEVALMRRIVFVLVVTALLVAVLVFGGPAWAQVQPPLEKGCSGIETAEMAQVVNPTGEDNVHSDLVAAGGVREQHKCRGNRRIAG